MRLRRPRGRVLAAAPGTAGAGGATTGPGVAGHAAGATVGGTAGGATATAVGMPGSHRGGDDRATAQGRGRAPRPAPASRPGRSGPPWSGPQWVARRGRTQWLALGAALVVLAGVIVAWALASAGRRVLVVRVAQPVSAGSVIDAADLATTGVAFDPGVAALVPAASLDALIGRVAAIDLEQGVLLQRGMWREGEPLVDGEQAVGAVLEAGRFPLGIGIGDVVLGAPLGAAVLAVGGGPLDGGATDGPADTPSTAGQDPSTGTTVTMRIIDVVALDNGSVSLSFAVPVADAVLVAQLSATGQLVVVRLPSGGGFTDSSSSGGAP